MILYFDFVKGYNIHLFLLCYIMHPSNSYRFVQKSITFCMKFLFKNEIKINVWICVEIFYELQYESYDEFKRNVTNFWQFSSDHVSVEMKSRPWLHDQLLECRITTCNEPDPQTQPNNKESVLCTFSGSFGRKDTLIMLGHWLINKRKRSYFEDEMTEMLQLASSYRWREKSTISLANWLE